MLLLAGLSGVAAWALSVEIDASAPLAGSDVVVATVDKPASAPPPASTTTTSTVAPSGMATTTVAPEPGPEALPSEWHDRLWMTLPATATSPERSAPVILVGPDRDPDNEWNPAFGTVEVYQDHRLTLPCEGGAVFSLGHANFSTADQAWDFFYDVIDSERYEGDAGLVAGQQIVISLDDGTELCRYQVFDLVEGPGEHLSASPGRYFLKSELSGEPGDPTGGPDDQLIRRAWDFGEPTLYLLGSYAGPSGTEMDATGTHQAYNFVVAARLVEEG